MRKRARSLRRAAGKAHDACRCDGSPEAGFAQDIPKRNWGKLGSSGTPKAQL